MINATELRLFNNVSYHGSIDTVVGIKHDYPDCEIKISDFLGGVIWVNDKDIEGIDLTPEWLERMGGVKNPKTPFFCINMPYNVGEININPDNGTVWLNHHRNESTHLNPMSGDKYYVHQLQNLYFALTGEELPIKETV
jgi:hypothetical protein